MNGLTTLQVLGSEVSTNVNNQYSLTDLYKASGVADNRKKPKAWLRLKRTKSLIEEVEKEYLRVDFSPLNTAGKAGTFACEELITAYAMHISPAFELVVIKAFLADARKKLRQAALHGKAEWQQNRELGIFQRHDMTDCIKSFVDYSQSQGSRGAHHYYTNITKCVQKAVAVTGRDDVDEGSLHLLATAELIAERAIFSGMAEQLPFKTVYQGMKSQMDIFGAMVLKAA